MPFAYELYTYLRFYFQYLLVIIIERLYLIDTNDLVQGKKKVSCRDANDNISESLMKNYALNFNKFFISNLIYLSKVI